MRKSQLLAILVMILLTAMVAVSASTELRYQGRLTDQGGFPADSFFDIAFRLYSDPTGVDILWEEVHGVQVTDGVLSVILGSITPLDMSTMPVHPDLLWLGIQVGSDPEISPRTRFTSVPSAAVSSSVRGEVSIDNGVISIIDSNGDTTVTWSAYRGEIKNLFPPGNKLGSSFDPGSNRLIASTGDTTIILDAEAAKGVVTDLHPPMGDGTGHQASQGIDDSSSFVEMVAFNDVDSSQVIVSAIESRSILKTYFETGDVPTEAAIFSTTDSSVLQLRHTTGSWDTEILSMSLNGSASIAADWGGGIDDDCDGIISADESGARMSVGANSIDGGVSVTSAVNRLDHHGHVTVLKIGNGGLDTTSMVSLFGDPDFAMVQVGDENPPDSGFVVTSAVNMLEHNGHVNIIRIASSGLDTTHMVGLFGDPDFAMIQVGDSAILIKSDTGGTSFRMNKAELIDAIASTIEDRTGSASISRRAARTGRNPQTGMTIQMSSETGLNDTTGVFMSMRRLDDDSDDDGLLDLIVSDSSVGIELSNKAAGDTAKITVKVDKSTPLLFMTNDQTGTGGLPSKYEFTLNPDRMEFTRTESDGGPAFGVTLDMEKFVRASMDPGGDSTFVLDFANSSLSLRVGGTDPNRFDIADLTGDRKLDLSVPGGVSIGTSLAPTAALDVAGDICVTGTVGSCSDARYKQDITPLTGAMGAIRSIQSVNYSWRQDEFAHMNFSNKRQIGFIAQDLEKIVPGVVSKNADGYYSVDYGRLTPVLVEALKEQQSEIEFMRNEIAELKALVTKLAEQNNSNGSTAYGIK